ncbi:LLM class flavin-dependent oxidoreductase [Sphingobium fuliginis]|uniref:LLM class flavin-dependent oxidoreductase n=1 Tax=Sphingobium fuliginis (strain ATCC 27551) TaxID=336203 RepID=A0A7M2GMF7_SPHSA|nr:LLM class flavin-dependent oxidoreductase [Sphingobium fuliginis]QOT73946.1 LLM class flavin-dependent oxidoreductase [Sphingobium fuliginis]
MSGNRMKGANKLKLGLFGLNCSGGLTMTKAAERWDPSWRNNETAAKLADDAGLEFVLPIARWLGYKGETDTEGTTFETLTWASGLLAATKEISAFGTLHVGLIHPVFAAKQIVTAHHIGAGRFGLNAVSGWNEGEYGMFNVQLLEHDDRYVYSDEWLSVAKKIWTSEEPFDHKGRFFDLKGVLSKPKPYGGEMPMIMSAGSSGAGRQFAMTHADCLFMSVIDIAKLPGEVAQLRSEAGSRNVGFYTSGHMLTRATEKEAQEYYRYIVHENGDWEGAEYIVNVRLAGGTRSIPPEVIREMKERHMAGIGSYPLVGSYDQVVDTLKRLSDAGLSGVAFGLVNYIDEFPIVRDEILPRLERLGLRLPHRPA